MKPHVGMDIFLSDKSRADMQLLGLLSWKLSEILRFQILLKLRFRITLMYKNCHNSPNFKATGLLFLEETSYFGSKDKEAFLFQGVEEEVGTN